MGLDIELFCEGSACAELLCGGRVGNGDEVDDAGGEFHVD